MLEREDVVVHVKEPSSISSDLGIYGPQIGPSKRLDGGGESCRAKRLRWSQKTPFPSRTSVCGRHERDPRGLVECLVEPGDLRDIIVSVAIATG